MFLLADFQRWLLGLSPDVDRHLSEAVFYLAGGWPLKSAAVVLGLAALWFGFLYLKDGTRPSLWTKVPLLILRLTAVAALLLMLLQPMLRLHKTERIRSNIAVLVDDSLSMKSLDPRLSEERAAQTARGIGATPSAVRGMTRAQIAERLLANPQLNLLQELSRKYNARLYRFASDAGPLPSDRPVSLAPDEKRGSSTQIGTALRRVIDDLSGQRVSGALILSDGGSNLGDDPASVAELAKEQGIRVSTVGIGDPTPTKDLAVTEVLADEAVRKENLVQVFAGISQRGYDGRTVTVTLRRGSEIIQSRTLRLASASQKQTVTFEYTPKQEGTFRYTVTAAAFPDEVTGQNNRREYLQKVVGKQLKILYVEGEPRWEYRYLKNAILRDKQIRFACILVTGASVRSGGEGNVPIFGFPTDEKSLFDYDILILGDVPRSYFTDAQVRFIRRFVEDRGGSLVAIAGEKHFPAEYRGSSLEAIFPVVLGPVQENVTTEEPFQWELTEAGKRDPIFRLSENPAENDRIWQQLPGMFWNAGVERAKPGATVLAVNPVRTNLYGKRVLAAVQPFGAGRCFMSLVDSTWRWRWRVGDKYFYRYWGQVVRTMTPREPPGGNRFVQVNPDRSEYHLGDRVWIHARILDSFFRPIKQNRVTATLRSDSGSAQTITLSAAPGSPGLFTADFIAERTGKFTLSVASPDNPASRASAAFLVQSLALERQQPEMNEPLLKKISVSGGGKYYRPDQLGEWLASLQANDLTLRSETEQELWDTPLLLILFITPLTLEWILRKRTGLM